MKQETVSGNGISWAICKSAPRCRQTTMPAHHHSSFLQSGCPSCCPTNCVKALKAVKVLRAEHYWWLKTTSHCYRDLVGMNPAVGSKSHKGRKRGVPVCPRVMTLFRKLSAFQGNRGVILFFIYWHFIGICSVVFVYSVAVEYPVWIWLPFHESVTDYVKKIL